MTHPRRPALVLALTALVAASGCMFRVKHTLPSAVCFGHLPDSRGADSDGAESQRFEAHGMKNWALAGFVPYSSWGTADLLGPTEKAQRVEDIAIETRFSALDTVIWVFPGFAYGYYVWAPRTIAVSGRRVSSQSAKP